MVINTHPHLRSIFVNIVHIDIAIVPVLQVNVEKEFAYFLNDSRLAELQTHHEFRPSRHREEHQAGPRG